MARTPPRLMVVLLWACCIGTLPVRCDHRHGANNNNHSVVSIASAPAWVEFMAAHAPAAAAARPPAAAAAGPGGAVVAAASWPRAMATGDIVGGAFELVEFVRAIGPPTGSSSGGGGGTCVVRHSLDLPAPARDASASGASGDGRLLPQPGAPTGGTARTEGVGGEAVATLSAPSIDRGGAAAAAAAAPALGGGGGPRGGVECTRALGGGTDALLHDAYVLGGRVGRGAQGEVWRAVRAGGGTVILKRLFADKPGAMRSGGREVYFGRRTSGAPHIAR